MAARPPTFKDAIEVVEVVEEWRDILSPNRTRMVVAVDASTPLRASAVLRLRNGDLYNVQTAFEHVRGRYEKRSEHRLYEVVVDKWPV